MSEAVPALSIWDGLPEGGVSRLLERGRSRGVLTQDDLMTVLESVELSAPLIDALVSRVKAEGIRYVDDHDDHGEVGGNGRTQVVRAPKAGDDASTTPKRISEMPGPDRAPPPPVDLWARYPFGKDFCGKMFVGPETDPTVVEQFRRLGAALHHHQLQSGARTVLDQEIAPRRIEAHA